MKLSPETVKILSNFASINQSVVLKADKPDQATISPESNIYAKATLKEKFPVDVAIYQLNQFLSVLGMYEDPDINFEEQFLTIKQGRMVTKIVYADQEVIVKPTKDITMPPVVVSFGLAEDTLSRLLKSADLLSLPNLQVTKHGEDVVFSALDCKNPNSNTYDVQVGEDSGSARYNFFFKRELLKILPGMYNVEIAERAVAKFVNQGLDVQYFIALEPNSKYDAS